MRSCVLIRASLVALAVLASLPASAVRAPEESLLPDLDVRMTAPARLQAVVALRNGVKPSDLIAGPPMAPGPVREAALERLARQAGPLEVRWDDVTGSPRLLFARQGSLAGPDARAPEIVARDFVHAHRALFLLDEAQVAALEVRHVIPNGNGGAVVRFGQALGGLPVLHGSLAVSVTPDGSILHVMGGRVTGAGVLPGAAPRSDPGSALRVLAAACGVEIDAIPDPVGEVAGGALFRLKAFREDVVVRPIILPTAGGPRRAWSADLFVAGSSGAYAVVVDDATLAPVRRATLTWHLDTRGRVFTNNPATSAHALVRFPDATDYRFDHAPLGWADEFRAPLVTIGNNAIVQDDLAGDDEATPGRTASATGPSPGWTFDHPFTGGGPSDEDASLTSLFHGINYSHARFHGLGFDERSGNFQSDNFGRGGLGGDPVLGDDRDGSGTNNANFQTPPDGFPGRMQMFMWDVSGEPRSSSFETGIVIHEYGHGVSTRLVGGPDAADCLFGFQSGSLGEAWSDYFASSFLEDPVIAEWVSGDPAGIRMYRLDDNPPNGKDYRDFCTYPNDAPPICRVHDNGEMWSGLLWLIRDEYRAAYGDAEGARRADELVMDGLKYATCEPSMLDARDALVLADRLQTGGQMECVIKSLAASRWMGSDASSTGGSDSAPVAGSATWPECQGTATLRFDRDELQVSAARATYGCDDSVGILLVDGNDTPAADSLAVIVRRAAVEVDRELLSPAAGEGIATFTASIRTTTAVGVPLDGVLNVQPGDEIEASYVDMVPGGTVAIAVADISCTPRLAIVRHRVLNGSCDEDTVPGHPGLPGFVDAGETADLVVEITNLAPVPVAGLMRVASDNPNLEILPASPFPVSFPAAVGTSPASAVLRLKAIASPAVTPGELARVQFTLEGPAFAPGVAAMLPLEMGLDYLVESGLTFTEDFEGESAPAGPEWTRHVLGPGGGNQWTIVTCANTTPAGTKAFRNGPATCTGRYSDAQGNPYILSPGIDFFDPATRAARVTQTSWQNDIDLGVTGFPPTIPLALDADAVVVTLTNDPTELDPTDPISIATSALAFYIRVDIPGFFSQNSNTTGWEFDERTFAPGQITGVDLSQPTYLAWYFLPDITFVQPPLDAQGEGYYLDDVRLTWERVQAVPQAAACSPVTAVLAMPRVSDPILGAACAGALVTVDGSASESALCGPPADLEYRFLRDGLVVACLLPDGVTPRTQDGDGWGATATCSETVDADATWILEARCQASPLAVDAASASVRIIDGLPVLDDTGLAFCAGSGTVLAVDASASSLVGCPGLTEYRFFDAAGPLDCDGDTLPDDWGTSPTCNIGPSDMDLEVFVGVRCDVLPACELFGSTTIPAVSATAAIVEATTAPGGWYCSGSTATLDAGGSVVTGCDGGVPQYRYVSTAGFDSGWIADDRLDVVVTADADWSVGTRCSLNASCLSAPAGPVSLRVRTGSFVLSQSADPADCPGDLFRLAAGVRDPPGVRCGSSVEYRFVRQLPGPPVTLEPITCFDDEAGTLPRAQDVDGWGTGTACSTPHLAGGGDFVVEYRCEEDPACVLETSLPRRIVPQSGIPAGTTPGTLRVRKTDAGCVPGSDVRLSWGDSDYAPTSFLVFRSDDPDVDLVGERLAIVDDIVHVDSGVACDGGGTPYLGRAVYFYQHAGRNTCTGEPLP